MFGILYRFSINFPTVNDYSLLILAEVSGSLELMKTWEIHLAWRSLAPVQRKHKESFRSKENIGIFLRKAPLCYIFLIISYISKSWVMAKAVFPICCQLHLVETSCEVDSLSKKISAPTKFIDICNVWYPRLFFR